MLGQKLSESLGQQVVIDNRTGANGNIGMEIVAKAPADGHTIVLGYIANVAIGPSLYDKLPFDPVKDYEHVTLLATSPNVLVAHPSVKATNMKELIALAKAQPGKLSLCLGGRRERRPSHRRVHQPARRHQDDPHRRTRAAGRR